MSFSPVIISSSKKALVLLLKSLFFRCKLLNRSAESQSEPRFGSLWPERCVKDIRSVPQKSIRGWGYCGIVYIYSRCSRRTQRKPTQTLGEHVTVTSAQNWTRNTAPCSAFSYVSFDTSLISSFLFTASKMNFLQNLSYVQRKFVNDDDIEKDCYRSYRQITLLYTAI